MPHDETIVALQPQMTNQHPKSDKSAFKVVKKSQIQKIAMIPNICTTMCSLTTKTRKMTLLFDLVKVVRILNFQKKLVKKLTQLIFEKIDDK